MSVIRVTMTTSGQSSRASIGIGKPYLVHGDPAKTPDHPEFQGYQGKAEPLPPANAKAAKAREKRLAEYFRLRDEGKDRIEAAAAIRIKESTSREYESQYERRGDGSDA